MCTFPVGHSQRPQWAVTLDMEWAVATGHSRRKKFLMDGRILICIDKAVRQNRLVQCQWWSPAASCGHSTSHLLPSVCKCVS